LEESIEKTLQKNYSVTRVTDPEFPFEFVHLEQKHMQKRVAMKIGLVYCRQGQRTPAEMFQNGRDGDCSSKFWDFVHLLGKRVEITESYTKYRGDMRPPGTAYYSVWKDVEIIYHVAPILNEEETRRLIGNDIMMLIFLEEGDDVYFDPSEIDKFGEVPQGFVVVQPVGDRYRIASFKKKNLTEHSPKPPIGLIESREAKECILTKLYNGLLMTSYCPPMNRLFSKPRQDTLDDIVSKYLPLKTKLKKKNSSPNVHTKINSSSQPPLVSMRSLPAMDNAMVTFIAGDSNYNPINSLVLLVASNIAYEEYDVIKDSCTNLLGFTPDKVAVIKERDNLFYIASDPQKVFIVFRGMTDMEKEKKIIKYW